VDRQDGLAAVAGLDRGQPAGDLVERLIPGDRRELALPLGADPAQRRQHPMGSVQVLAEPPHLAADEAVGDRVAPIAVDPGHPAGLDLDLEAAQVRAVEGTGAAVDGGHARL
jgi:hypothetical protein